MTYATLSCKIADHVAEITLNRPEKRNAISPEMIADLLAALDEIEKSPARVVILTGAGKAFCAGMDLAYLKEFPSQSREQVMADARKIAGMFRRVYKFPKPLIAAVHGPALAGGCALATFADFTLATTEAKFGYTEVRIGFIPAIISALVVRQLGEKRARELLLSGRIFSAEEACALGLVNEIVPPENLLSRARERAQELATMSPVALQFTKSVLIKMIDAELDRELELAVDASTRVRSTADFREGLAAFLEKRKPEWTGR